MQIGARVRVFRVRDEDIHAIAYKCIPERDDLGTTKEEIGAEMKMDDFIHALALAYGNPMTVLTRKKHQERIEKAALEVLSQMKRTTTSVATIGLGDILNNI